MVIIAIVSFIIMIIYTLILFGSFISGRLVLRNKHGFDGNIVISRSETGTKVFTIELEEDPDILERKYSVWFKILISK